MYCPSSTIIEPPPEPLPLIETLQVNLAKSTPFTSYNANNNDPTNYSPYEAIMPCINNTASENTCVSDCNVFSLVNHNTTIEYQEVACLREGRAIPIYPGTQYCSYYSLYFRGIGEYTLHSLHGIDCAIGQRCRLCRIII